MNERTVSIRAGNACYLAQVKFSPDVVRVRFKLGMDWSDDPAVFFSVLLSDEFASTIPRKAVVGPSSTKASRIRELDYFVRQALDGEEYGYHAYFNFRSVSEQERAPDKDYD